MSSTLPCRAWAQGRPVSAGDLSVRNQMCSLPRQGSGGGEPPDETGHRASSGHNPQARPGRRLQLWEGSDYRADWV